MWRQLPDLDFTRLLPAALLGLVYVAVRLPWISLGYGADPDAWRVALSARYLLAHGSYLPSRLPGYPVHDILMAGLLWGGWVLTNAATIVVSFIGVLLFAAILRRLRSPMPAVLTLTFAFLPLLWSTSVATLDYSWALTLLLVAYFALLKDRVVMAGALLGLAGGCRVTYLAFALPLGLLALQGGQLRPALRFFAAVLATWTIVFAPVWLRYGLSFWNFYDVRPGWGDFARSLTEGTVGLLPLMVLSVALALSWSSWKKLPSVMRQDPQVAVWAMIALLSGFVYIRLPLQTYYLIPAAPFGLLLLGRVLRPNLLLVTCAALLLGGLVDVYTTTDTGWRSPAALLHIRPAPGLILQDYRLRSDRLALVRQVPQIPLPSHSVLTAGFYFPMVVELHHSDLNFSLPDGYLQEIGPLTDNAQAQDSRDRVYVWLLTQGDARRLALDGYRIYSLDFSRESGTPQAIAIYRPENERFGIH